MPRLYNKRHGFNRTGIFSFIVQIFDFSKIDSLETAFYFRIIVQDALTWIEQVNYGMKKVFLVDIQLIFHVAKFSFVIEVWGGKVQDQGVQKMEKELFN